MAQTDFYCSRIGVDKKVRVVNAVMPGLTNGLRLKAGANNIDTIYIGTHSTILPGRDSYALAKGEEVFIPVDSLNKVYCVADSTVDSQQTIALSGDITTDLYKLVFEGNETTPISVSATPAQVQLALANLVSVGAGNVTVVAGVSPIDYVITFTGVFKGIDVPLLQSSNAGTNEQQTIIITLAAIAGGTFTLTFEGSTTAPIPYNSTPVSVQLALEAVLGPNVTVTGSPGAFVVQFINALGVRDVSMMVVDTSGTIPTPYTASIVETIPGTTATNERQQVLTNAVSGTFTLSYNGLTTAPIPYNVTAANLRTALLPILGTGGDCNVTAVAGGWQVEFRGTLQRLNVPMLTMNTTGLNVPTATVTETIAAHQCNVLINQSVSVLNNNALFILGY